MAFTGLRRAAAYAAAGKFDDATQAMDRAIQLQAQRAADGEANERRCLSNLEFLHHVGSVSLRGLRRYSKELRDLFARVPFGNQLDDFVLPRGQGEGR